MNRAFVDKVQAVLGPAQQVVETASGRTILRYADFTVSPEGSLAIAAKMIPGRMLFAVVGSGTLEWKSNRPETQTDTLPPRPRKRFLSKAA